MESSALSNLHWRVCRTIEKTSRFKERYRVVTLARTDSQIDAFIWPSAAVKDQTLATGTVVFADLWSRKLGGKTFLSANALVCANTESAEWIELLPRALCSDLGSLNELQDLLKSLPYTALTKFAGQVLSEEIGTAFITIPGSYSFHHAQPSGLLTHSVDCARRFLAMAPGFTTEEIAIGTVATLFHDIGKVQTLGSDGRKTELGISVHHEALTLEICAAALRQLDKEWPQAARLLRTIWTWRTGPHVDWRNQPSLAIAVSAADRLSSELDKRISSEKSKRELNHAAR